VPQHDVVSVPRRPTFSRRLGQLLYGSNPGARGPAELRALLTNPQLQAMFARMAGTYDAQNRLLSMGIDRHWRALFVDSLRPAPHCLIGDLAVGTAEVAIAICRRYPSVRVVGVDQSAAMLRIGGRKVAAGGLAGRITLREGDLRRLPLASGSLDAVTMCFGIRNVEDRRGVLAECFRVLRPGGRIAIMETTMPRGGAAGGVYRWYFDRLMPLLGNLLSRTDYAYDYLRLSVHAFPEAERFLEEIGSVGFVQTAARPITFGTATIYRGTRPRGAAA
jgi:demethylmenaquinone methyltransferase/2-methoxy-6-polyprenyl-1,4-benzoquinol methylase